MRAYTEGDEPVIIREKERKEKRKTREKEEKNTHTQRQIDIKNRMLSPVSMMQTDVERSVDDEFDAFEQIEHEHKMISTISEMTVVHLHWVMRLRLLLMLVNPMEVNRALVDLKEKMML